MIGVVLCGGQSLRMGADKGLLPSRQTSTWAQLACSKLAALNLPVKVSVNQLQQETYSSIFSEADIIADNVSLLLKGPLLGVLSSHMQFPSDDLMVLACDMPLMEISMLEKLYKNYHDYPSFDAYIFTDHGEPEPLAAIYTATPLHKTLTMLQNGTLFKHAMKYMIDHLAVHSTAIKEDQKKYFQNFNTLPELNGQ